MPAAPSFGRPRLLVKFVEFVDVPPHGLDVWLDAQTNGAWTVLRTAHTGLTAGPAVADIRRVDGLVARATAANPKYRAPKFRNFLYLDGPLGTTFIAIAHAIRAWRIIDPQGNPSPAAETMFLDVPAGDPFVLPADDPVSPSQAYLAGETNAFLDVSGGTYHGVDARYAWRFAGGDGDGRRIADVERGWNRSHVDLRVTVHRVASLSPEQAAA